MSDATENTAERGIPTNLRLLVLLEEIAAIGNPVAPSDLYARIDLPKPTLHRLFSTLETEGFIERQPDGRRYLPAPRLRRLARHVVSAAPERAEVLLILQALSEQIGETCNFSIPERSGMKYVDRAETEWPLRLNLPVGTVVPFHCTAAGKLYLATLPAERLDRLLDSLTLAPKGPNAITERAALEAEIEAIRNQGFAEDNEEFTPGMIGIAVEVRAEGRFLGTLSFHAPTQRLDLAAARRHVPLLEKTAKRIAAALVP